MGKPRGKTDHDGDAMLFRLVERLDHHVVSFLLARRLVNRHKRELAIEAAVLFVLAGMHRGIIRNGQHQTAMRAGDGGIDERIGRDVHADVFHAHQRALPGKRHAERGLHRRLLIATPLRTDSAPDRLFRLLYIFGDFRRRRTGIGVNPGDPGINRRLRYRFVTKP